MPNGPPFQSAPKSMCSVSDAPMDAMRVLDAGSTGSSSTGVFHGSDAGKIRKSMGAPGPTA